MKTRTLRLPDELDAKLERTAADERRSVNAQIVLMLERATQPVSYGRPASPDAE